MHLVEQQQDPLVVGERAQILQEAPGHLAHATFAHDQLNENAAVGPLADGRIDRVDVEGRHLVEAVDRRTEAFQMLGLTAGGDGGERPAVEGAFERQAITFRCARLEVVTARGP